MSSRYLAINLLYPVTRRYYNALPYILNKSRNIPVLTPNISGLFTPYILTYCGFTDLMLLI